MSLPFSQEWLAKFPFCWVRETFNKHRYHLLLSNWQPDQWHLDQHLTGDVYDMFIIFNGRICFSVVRNLQNCNETRPLQWTDIIFKKTRSSALVEYSSLIRWMMLEAQCDDIFLLMSFQERDYSLDSNGDRLQKKFVCAFTCVSQKYTFVVCHESWRHSFSGGLSRGSFVLPIYPIVHKLTVNRYHPKRTDHEFVMFINRHRRTEWRWSSIPHTSIVKEIGSTGEV